MSYKNYRNLRAVCHAFANNESQNGQSSNIFFYNGKAYSYGHHYVLAEKFNMFTVLNEVGYSSSTSKHISYMSSALRGQKVYATTNIVPRVVYNFLSANIEKLKRANKPENYIGLIQSRLSSYFDFWEKDYQNIDSICGYNVNEEKDGILYKDLISDIAKSYPTNKDDIKTFFVEKEKREKELKDKQDAKNKEKHLQSIKDFMNHKCYSVAYRPQNFEEILRISKDSLFVETSASARVNIKSALLLYKMIQAKKDIKGYQIDYYTVISINGTLKIGCHNIDMKSVHKIGNQLLKMSIAE
jgi:hypothetical protein